MIDYKFKLLFSFLTLFIHLSCIDEHTNKTGSAPSSTIQQNKELMNGDLNTVYYILVESFNSEPLKIQERINNSKLVEGKKLRVSIFFLSKNQDKEYISIRKFNDLNEASLFIDQARLSNIFKEKTIVFPVTQDSYRKIRSEGVEALQVYKKKYFLESKKTKANNG